MCSWISPQLRCQRYIELNTVRPAMVDDPAHYGLNSYRALFRPKLDDDAISDIRMALNEGQPPGSSPFLADIERAADQRREPRPAGDAVGIEPQVPLKI